MAKVTYSRIRLPQFEEFECESNYFTLVLYKLEI